MSLLNLCQLFFIVYMSTRVFLSRVWLDYYVMPKIRVKPGTEYVPCHVRMDVKSPPHLISDACWRKWKRKWNWSRTGKGTAFDLLKQKKKVNFHSKLDHNFHSKCAQIFISSTSPWIQPISPEKVYNSNLSVNTTCQKFCEKNLHDFYSNYRPG